MDFISNILGLSQMDPKLIMARYRTAANSRLKPLYSKNGIEATPGNRLTARSGLTDRSSWSHSIGMPYAAASA